MSGETNLLILILGWALGLFSPLVNDWLRKPFKNKELKAALCSELKGIRHQMVMCCYLLGVKSQQIDRAFLEWELNLMREYRSENPSDLMLQGCIEKLLTQEDGQLEALTQATTQQSQGKGLSLKHYRLLLLESKMQEISSLELPYQSKLSEIKYAVDCINEEVDLVMKFHDKTFEDSLSPQNKDLIKAQIRTTYGEIKQMMIRAANKMTQVIKESKSESACLSSTMKRFSTIAVVVFALVALVHLVRIVMGWEVLVNGVTIPMWVSVVGAVIVGGLGILLWRESRR